MLQEVVGLRERRVGNLTSDVLPSSPAGQAFLALLPETAHAFEQVGVLGGPPLLPKFCMLALGSARLLRAHRLQLPCMRSLDHGNT